MFFSNKNKIDSLFNFLKPYEDSALAIISIFDFYSPKVKSRIKNNDHIIHILKKDLKLVNQDSNNIVIEIKNSCYIPIQLIGIYQDDKLIINLNKNPPIEGKNYGESIKIQKMTSLMIVYNLNTNF